MQAGGGVVIGGTTREFVGGMLPLNHRTQPTARGLKRHQSIEPEVEGQLERRRKNRRLTSNKSDPSYLSSTPPSTNTTSVPSLKRKLADRSDKAPPPLLKPLADRTNLTQHLILIPFYLFPRPPSRASTKDGAAYVFEDCCISGRTTPSLKEMDVLAETMANGLGLAERMTGLVEGWVGQQRELMTGDGLVIGDEDQGRRIDETMRG